MNESEIFTKTLYESEIFSHIISQYSLISAKEWHKLILYSLDLLLETEEIIRHNINYPSIFDVKLPKTAIIRQLHTVIVTSIVFKGEITQNDLKTAITSINANAHIYYEH